MHPDSAITGLETFAIKGTRERNLCGDVQEKRDFARGVAFLGDITKLYLKSMMMNELASELLFPFPSVQQSAENTGAMIFFFCPTAAEKTILEY